MVALEDLSPKEQRGSRPRCLLLTEGSDVAVAERLTQLVAPFAKIEAGRHVWMPRGFAEPGEAKLGESTHFLSPAQRKEVRDWWLAVRRANTNTPNWDIASTATIHGQEGLVLVEAKAHVDELHAAGKPFSGNGASRSNPQNHARIGAAIAEANSSLNAVLPGFNLSRDSHYQLANRFAWAWKVATLGVPVVLVYLGCLKANEMQYRSPPFADEEVWTAAMLHHAHGVVPEAAWYEPMMIDGTPMRALIRAVEVPLSVTG